jgi:RNA polymerase sigma factor (sigma-70 family)
VEARRRHQLTQLVRSRQFRTDFFGEKQPAGYPYNGSGLIPVLEEVSMDSQAKPSPRPKRKYVMAMVLGTALSALGASPAHTAPAPDATLQAVGDLSRYCTVCWRNARIPADCWGDCTQEVFSRLLQRVSPAAWNAVLSGEGDERREFLRAIDAVKKRTQRSLRRSTGLVGVVADTRDRHERALADEREAVARAAGEVLSSRQRRILLLSFEGWSVQDIAGELHLPAERVSDEKYKAIRKLREHLCRAEAAAC